MMTTELVVMYFVSAVMKVDLLAFKDNATILFIETAGAKTFYFFVVMLMSKLRNRRNKSISNDFSMILLIMPFLTTFVIATFGKILVEIQINENIYMLFTVITLLLLLANLLVFFVHEKVVSTLTQNIELQLEKQRTQISDEYYKELEYQYNLSHVLVHDIKRQLTTIKDIANEENTPKISEYISSIYDSYEIHALKRFCSNKLLNIIVSRYSHLCYENNIELFTDIQNIDLSFISDGDLTAIMDNLLENAVESAVKSNSKNISLAIDKKNEQFVLISLTNSCDLDPEIFGDLVKSSKGDKNIHGYGLRSVRKAVKKNNGDIDFKYDSDKKLFTVTLMFKN